MTILEHVYKCINIKSWIASGQFKDKEDILKHIPLNWCPRFWIKDYSFYKPVKNDSDCKVAYRSEKYQKKMCNECWNREYVEPKIVDEEYELYLKLKAKYESGDNK
jgi:hypothetical protein